MRDDRAFISRARLISRSRDVLCCVVATVVLLAHTALHAAVSNDEPEKEVGRISRRRVCVCLAIFECRRNNRGTYFLGIAGTQCRRRRRHRSN